MYGTYGSVDFLMKKEKGQELDEAQIGIQIAQRSFDFLAFCVHKITRDLIRLLGRF